MDNSEERVPRIGEVKIKVQPDLYLKRAHQELSNGNDVLAVQNYVSYMESLGNNNEMKLIDQMNLTKLVLNLGATFEAMEEEDEVIRCYLEILNNLPRNALILNALATYLGKNGELAIAKNYFQIAANEGYLPAERNLLHTLWNLVPRWHFRMLNDSKRNETYQKTIHKAIKAGFTNIYDIGSGCGLLTLIAASFSEQVRVTAFEEDKTLCELASRIIKEHNLKNVTLHPKNSSEFEEPPEVCDLIVAEIFDAGLFGEFCLDTLYHAISTFPRDKNKFKIIPASARMYATAIQSRRILKKFRYYESLQELNIHNICITEANSEPYDTEDLKNDKKVKYMTETKAFLDVDFNNMNQLSDLLTSDDCIEEFSLVCKENGTIHAFAVWFDLNLDEELTISTNPFDSEIKCWEQAIFHLRHPVKVVTNQIIRIKPKLANNQLSFTLLDNPKDCHRCFQVNKDVITCLNDEKLVKTISESATLYNNFDLKIVDVNVFPLFGFLMAKKKATVYHIYKDKANLEFLEFVRATNQISESKLIFIDEQGVEDFLIYLEAPNLIFTDFLKTDGSWNQPHLSIEAESKLNCELLPKRILLKTQLISSDYIEICNRVNNEKTLNFKLDKHMNEFTGTEHPNIDNFQHEQFSKPVTFEISESELIYTNSEAEILKNGSINGILYWFDIRFSTSTEANIFSTLDSSHYNKVCTILPTPKTVKNGDKVVINVAKYEGHLKVYL